MDFLGDDEPDISIPSWTSASISEIRKLDPQEKFYSSVMKKSRTLIFPKKKVTQPFENFKAKWYQNYTLNDTYATWDTEGYVPGDVNKLSRQEVSTKETSLNVDKNQHEPKVKSSQKVSAMEYINWIRGFSNQDCRPKIFDSITKKFMLFDTGAMTCCLPKEKGDKIDKNCILRTADGNPMPTYGNKELKIRLGRKEYSISAKVTDVKQPIIGMDLIAKYKLGFDWEGDDLYVTDKKASSKQKLSFVTIVPNSLPTVKEVQSLLESKQILFEMTCVQKLEQNQSANFNTSEADLEKLLKIVPEPYRKLVKKYDILKPNFQVKPKHNIVHRIETGSSSPATCKVRPIPADKMPEVKALLDEMEKSGVIEKVGANSNTNWSSALHVVREKGKKPRVCVDYRILNSKIVNDSYPLPLIRNIAQKLHGAKYFSKIDLKKAYWNIPLFEGHKHKSTVITPFGAYFFNRLPFGIASAPNSFQKALESIFRDIPGLFIYMDDLLLYSNTVEEHEEIVQKVLEKLHQNGMAISLDKCVWQQGKVEYLGYVIDQNGLRPMPKKLDAISKIPVPTKQKDLLAFLGAANFYRRNLGKLKRENKMKNTAELIQCLYEIATQQDLNTSKKFVQQWNSNSKYDQAFKDAKELIKNSANLIHLNPNQPLALFVDASALCIGGTLRQMTPSGWQAIGFYSKSLNSSQQNYSTFRKELFALYMSLRHFLPEVLGRKLTCFSDHRAICDAFKRPELKQNDQVAARQMLEISQFTTDIQHISGVKNVTADFLSRTKPQPTPEITNEDVYQSFRPFINDTAETNVDVNFLTDNTNQNNAEVVNKKSRETYPVTAKIQTTIGEGTIQLVEELTETVQFDIEDIKAIATNQESCQETIAAKKGQHQKLASFASVKISGHDIYCEISGRKPRPLIPAIMRPNIIQTLHSIGHPSAKETLNRISSQYYWNKMQKSVNEYCVTCHQCLSVKPSKQQKPHIGEFEVPESRFTHLVVDIIELPKAKDGNKYAFTVICRTTRYFCCYPMKQATTENCLNGLLDFIGHFGIPLFISSDSGTQFISNLWKKLESTLGIELKRGPLYRPQAVGMVERSHQTFKNALKAQILDFANKNQNNWPQLINWALLSMRASYRSDLKASPSELAHGLKPALPGSLIMDPTPGEDLKTLLDKIKAKTDRPATQTKLNVPNPQVLEPDSDVTHAYTLQHNKTGLDPSYKGPFEIVKRLSRSSVRLNVGTYANNQMRTEDRHWSELKAVKLPKSTISEKRPKLGRPSKNFKPTSTNADPTTFTGFKTEEIPQRKVISWPANVADELAKIDFSKPPPFKSWSATPEELQCINEAINTRVR